MRGFTNGGLTDEEPIRFWVGGRLREVVAYASGGHTGDSTVAILKHISFQGYLK